MIGQEVEPVQEAAADVDFNLEDELLNHLALPESAQFIYKQRFDPDLIPAQVKEVRQVLQFVTSYIDEYKKPPTQEVLGFEFGIEFFHPKTEIGWLVEKYRDRYKKNKTKEILLAASRKVGADPDDAAKIAVSGLNHLQSITAPRQFEVTSSDWASELADYRERVLAGKTTGYTFGWPEIDEYIGGLKPGELVYVVGRPKRYKSWFLLNSAIATQMSTIKPGKVVFFTLEMSQQVMFQRYMSTVAGVGFSNFVEGRLSFEENKRMEQCEEWSLSLPPEEQIVFAHPPRGQRTVSALRQYALEHGADVVYIDQLSFLESSRQVSAEKRHMEVEYINEDLREAIEDFPIYIAAQFNREAASMTEMADLSKIGLSDSIGQKADMILGLYQSRDMKENNIVEFGVVDARNYGLHRWDMSINFSTTSINIDRKKVDF